VDPYELGLRLLPGFALVKAFSVRLYKDLA
jgi:hypothetical protein